MFYRYNDAIVNMDKVFAVAKDKYFKGDEKFLILFIGDMGNNIGSWRFATEQERDHVFDALADSAVTKNIIPLAKEF